MGFRGWRRVVINEKTLVNRAEMSSSDIRWMRIEPHGIREMGQGALHISKTSNRKVTSTNAAQQSNLHFDALETSHGRQRIGESSIKRKQRSKKTLDRTQYSTLGYRKYYRRTVEIENSSSIHYLGEIPHVGKIW
ncbi:uncharacterized protein LAJ45_00746 [Morchella importuna]|uniref:uncharacterized protein n=1 Tax=Morchella importuna TaxID=1174673 RepID=UPI001E8EF3FF|nr:uncharacterized protein LAJ45_00746 [Morchella importuna]KAH8155736.1 hypothetical protein LAJ45_00746 [Morchella importuna]